jgi:hypothetical protein
MSKGKGQWLVDRVMAGPNKGHEASIRKSEAAAFRSRLELLMDQMSRDRTSPFDSYIPMLCGAMSSMADEELLSLQDFLRSVVGDD